MVRVVCRGTRYPAVTVIIIGRHGYVLYAPGLEQEAEQVRRELLAEGLYHVEVVERLSEAGRWLLSLCSPPAGGNLFNPRCAPLYTGEPRWPGSSPDPSNP